MGDAVAEPAVGQRPEPLGRDGHDENRRRRNEAAENNHAIGRDPLREHPHQRRQKDNQDIVQPVEMPDGRALAQFANAEGRVGVIHMHENHLDKHGQRQKGQELVKAGLPPQAGEDAGRIARGIADRQPEHPQGILAGIFHLLRRDDNPLIRGFDPFTEPEVDDQEAGDGQRQAGQQNGAVGAELHAEPGQSEAVMLPQLRAQGIENQDADEESRVHNGVEDGEGDGTLRRGGVAPQGGDGHRRAHALPERQHGQADPQRQPLDRGKRDEDARDDAKRETEQERLAQPQRVGQRSDQHDAERQPRRPQQHHQARLDVVVAQVRGEPKPQGEVHHPVGQVAEQHDGKHDPQLAHRAKEHGELAQKAPQRAGGRRVVRVRHGEAGGRAGSGRGCGRGKRIFPPAF